jgi:hypothetical protein
MLASLKISAVLALGCVAALTAMQSASAVDVEVAKKCRTLTSAAFPPRAVGNPAAGSDKGSGKEVQDYYKKCLDNGGKTDDTGKANTNPSK